LLTAIGRCSPSVAGTCVVRDARDIIPFICGHYLRVGLAHIAFIDDGSTDGTFEFLLSLSRRTERISVRRVLDDEFKQRELMNEAVNSLIEAGYQIVLPFDADEFWNIGGARELEQRFATRQEVAFFGRWLNFVEKADLTYPRPLGLLRIIYRAVPMADANQESVTAFHRPFVCHSDTKVALKTTRTIEMDLGQHSVVPEVETCAPMT
jgi:Glycosyl transferase family 2